MVFRIRRIASIWLIVIPDIVLLFLALVLALKIRYPGGIDASQAAIHYKAFGPLFLLWLIVYFVHGLFEVYSFRRYTTLLFNLLTATAVNIGISIAYFYFQPNLILTPRRFLLIVGVVAFIFLLVWHLLLKYLLKNRLSEGVYIFAAGQEMEELHTEINNHQFLGFEVLGVIRPETIETESVPRNAAVILPDNLQAQPATLRRLYELRTKGTVFYNYRDFYEDLLRRVYLSEVSELWFLENISYQEKRFYTLLKRTLDIALGLVGIVIFLVTYPFIALAIKLTSPGPILFTQERVGQNGIIFKVYKYRTMAAGGVTNTWTLPNDPRITPLGNILRKTRLDELPQFINLLSGHMSLVGPRPEQVHIVEKLKEQIPFYNERHVVKPGITGWAQLNIYAGSLEETKIKLQYDLYYVKYRSIFFDMEIILKTLYYIFTWSGR